MTYDDYSGGGNSDGERKPVDPATKPIPFAFVVKFYDHSVGSLYLYKGERRDGGDTLRRYVFAEECPTGQAMERGYELTSG